MLYYKILGIGAIVMGSLSVINWLGTQDVYELIGGGLFLMTGIAIMKLINKIHG